jgi:hypothetical protein
MPYSWKSNQVHVGPSPCKSAAGLFTVDWSPKSHAALALPPVRKRKPLDPPLLNSVTFRTSGIV